MEGKSPCTSQQVVIGLFCVTFKAAFKCVRFHVNGSNCDPNIPLGLFGAWKLLFADAGFSSSWWETCPETGGVLRALGLWFCPDGIRGSPL